jgi:Uma2 family endonuclease
MPVATTTDLLEVIARMRPGAAYCVDGVPWEEYEELLGEVGESSSVRVYYDQGRVEIMAPAYFHERAKSVMHDLVTALRDELKIKIISLGSTTLKRELRAKGGEPDDGFYIQNAARVAGLEELDLDRDPPPDLVIEIDRSSSSPNKFSIYAGLGVPEIWRVASRQVQIWLLTGDRYNESGAGRAFPFLSADTLSQFLGVGLAHDEGEAARAFREWIKASRSGNQ